MQAFCSLLLFRLKATHAEHREHREEWTYSCNCLFPIKSLRCKRQLQLLVSDQIPSL